MAGYFGDSYSAVQSAALNDQAQLQAQYARTMANLLGALSNRKKDKQYEEALAVDKERYGDKLRSSNMQDGFDARKIKLAEGAAEDKRNYDTWYRKLIEDQELSGGLTPAQRAAQEESQRRFALSQAMEDFKLGILPEDKENIAFNYPGIGASDVANLARRSALWRTQREQDYDTTAKTADVLNRQALLPHYIQQSKLAQAQAVKDEPGFVSRMLRNTFQTAGIPGLMGRATPDVSMATRQTPIEIGADISDWQTELNRITPVSENIRKNRSLMDALTTGEAGRYAPAMEAPRSRQAVSTRVATSAIAPANPAVRVLDELYTLPNGKRAFWRGNGWELAE